MKTVKIILIVIASVATTGCFNLGQLTGGRPQQSVPNALTPGTESCIDCPGRAGGLNSGWSNSGGFAEPCRLQPDGSCR